MSGLPETLTTKLNAIHAAATRRLAREPVALDVHELSSVTDVLYVCHGDSTRAVDAIVDEIVGALEGTYHVEGRDALQWVLIDAGDVMVHVFLRERRSFYDLERLWHDARPLELPEP